MPFVHFTHNPNCSSWCITTVLVCVHARPVRAAMLLDNSTDIGMFAVLS